MRNFKITDFCKFLNNKQKVKDFVEFWILTTFFVIRFDRVVNGLVSSTRYNQNLEEDRGTVNTKKAERNKGKDYFVKKIIFWRVVYTFTISFIIYL